MPDFKTASPIIRFGLIVAGVALCAGAVAAPAAAQPRDQPPVVVDELTVTGRYGVGAEVRALSAAVSYRDLDLTTEEGRDALRQRVRAAAYDLCRRLGEAGAGDTPLAPSCERGAIDSAREQERLAVANAVPRAYAVVPPPAPQPEAVAPAAETYGRTASVTTETVTNPPVQDTPANRAAYGGPNSTGGRRTTPAGN